MTIYEKNDIIASSLLKKGGEKSMKEKYVDKWEFNDVIDSFEEKFFDKWEFNEAIDSFEESPFVAKTKIENYIEKYPYDYTIYPFYAGVLIGIGELDKAEEILSLAEQKVYRYSNKDRKEKQLRRDIFYSRVKLLSYQKKYKELYNLLYSKKVLSDDIGLYRIMFYCRRKMGLISSTDDIRASKTSYIYRQIIEYRESDFREHIKKHLADAEENIELSGVVFAPNFPIDKVIEEIKKYIPSDKKTNNGFYDNIYIFKYDYCGKVEGKTVDYFTVVCFDDTQDIITIYPTAKGKNFPYVDLNYLVDNKTNPKVRKISQIDKFSQRYGTK